MEHGVVDLVTVFNAHIDAVRYLQAGGLTEILDAVDQFACDTLLNQFVRELDIQGDGQNTVVRHEPARHIFGNDFYILGTECVCCIA